MYICRVEPIRRFGSYGPRPRFSSLHSGDQDGSNSKFVSLLLVLSHPILEESNVTGDVKNWDWSFWYTIPRMNSNWYCADPENIEHSKIPFE
jgi:hypothetical protein